MPSPFGIHSTRYQPLTDLSQRSRMESLNQSLARWVIEAPQGEPREEMFHSVWDAYKRDCTQLDLDCQGLTLMPRIPRCVKSLTMSNVASPDVLAKTEFHSDLEGLEIRNSSLASLPTLPDKIASVLLVNCTALTSLQGLPKELKTLYLVGCDGITDFSDLPPGANFVTLPQTPASEE